MTKYDEAIKILENMQDVECGQCPNEEICNEVGTGLCVNAVNVAREALQQAKECEKSYKKIEIVTKFKDCESVSYICENCNWNVDVQDKFCKRCGRKLSD